MEKKDGSMRRIVEGKLCPVMEDLFDRVWNGGLGLKIDGTPAYNEKAQFVGGKVINQACYTAVELLKTEESLEKLGDMIRMVSDMPMETWGILNGISGLYRLEKAGLLKRVVDEETLGRLKVSMDWRTFVDVKNHYALIHKPTNYYGVAFGIARHRELLGWEPEGHSIHLLNRLMEHIDQYSGELCFMDETPGEGRFDRYSILVPSELTSQLLDTGWQVPEKIRNMLTKSAHIFLELADEEGQGFSYGRSIGAYGDTAALEVLSAAAALEGVLGEDEKELAYGYSIRLLEHMVDFWYDTDMESVNMWEKGRKTDNYRNKNRILGENLSLCMQMVNSFEHWERAGYGDRDFPDDYGRRLEELRPYLYVPFAGGAYERGLAIVRDGRNIWSLPLINGGQKYYDKDPYMPVPFQNLVLEGVPEHHHGQLVPQFWMEDGEILMPLAYMTRITPKEEAGKFSVTCRFESLCRMGEGIFVNGQKEAADSVTDNSVAGGSQEAQRPKKAEGARGEVRYTFSQGKIKREDVFTFDREMKVKKVRLVFLTYSEKPCVGENDVEFGEGIISAMKARGYGSCSFKKAAEDGSFDTPHGRLSGEAVWEREMEVEDNKTDETGRMKLELSWEMEYRRR